MPNKKIVKNNLKDTPILSLPPEILWNIGYKLNPNDVHNLMVSCKKLWYTYNTGRFWYPYLIGALDSYYPPQDRPYERFPWGKAINSFLAEREMWHEDRHKNMQSVFHRLPVTAVKIHPCGYICATGGQDHSIALWHVFDNLTYFDPSPKVSNLSAHNSWVSGLELSDIYMYSSGWDKIVRKYDMVGGMTEVKHVFCGENIYNIQLTANNTLTAGLTTGRMRIYDSNNMELLYRFKHHDLPILGLSKNGPYIFSISEDKTVAMHDLRNHKNIRYSATRDSRSMLEGIPLTVSAATDTVYIGDNVGNIYLFNHKTMEYMDTYITNQGPIISLKQTCGSLAVGYYQGFVQLLEKCSPPKPYMEYWVRGGNILSMDFHNNVFLIGKRSIFEIVSPLTHPRLDFYLDRPHEKYIEIYQMLQDSEFY